MEFDVMFLVFSEVYLLKKCDISTKVLINLKDCNN